MTYIVSGGALNSTHSLTHATLNQITAQWTSNSQEQGEKTQKLSTKQQRT